MSLLHFDSNSTIEVGILLLHKVKIILDIGVTKIIFTFCNESRHNKVNIDSHQIFTKFCNWSGHTQR